MTVIFEAEGRFVMEIVELEFLERLGGRPNEELKILVVLEGREALVAHEKETDDIEWEDEFVVTVEEEIRVVTGGGAELLILWVWGRSTVEKSLGKEGEEGEGNID